MEWEEGSKIAAAAMTGGNYVSLKNDGENVIGFFRGKPDVKFSHYNETIGKSEPWTPAHEAAGKKKTTKFIINIFVIKDLKMKILTLSPALYEDVVKAKQKFDHETWSFEIIRKGAKGDTNTKYQLLPDISIDKLTPEQRAKLDAAVIHDLSKESHSAEDDASTDMNSHKNGAAAAISADESAALTSRLKALPRSVVDAFLAKFSVTKVKDLPAAKYAEASTFVGSHEPKAAPAAAAEIDPFGLQSASHERRGYPPSRSVPRLRVRQRRLLVQGVPRLRASPWTGSFRARCGSFHRGEEAPASGSRNGHWEVG